MSRQIRPFLRLHVTSFLCITAASLLALLTPLVLKWLIDQVVPQKQLGLLLLAVTIVFLGHQGKTVLTGVGTYLTLSAAQQMGLRLRMSLLRHLNTLSADYYEDTPVGIAMYPFKEPIDEISYFGSDLLPAILRALLTTGFTVTTMFVLNPGLTFALLPLLPAFLMARQHFRQRLTIDADFVQADRLKMNDFLEEHLSAVTAIQLLGQRKRQERKAFQGFARAVRSQQRLFRSGVWFTVATSFAVVLSMCAVVGYGGWKALTGALSVGTCIHITPAWDLTNFFSLANTNGIPYDAICQSYYPLFHGPLTAAQAAASNPNGQPVEENVLNAAANSLGKPIFIIETGEHYENGFLANDPWYPPSQANQAQFLRDLDGVQKALPNSLGMGIAYWDPAGVNIPRIGGGLFNGGTNQPDAIYVWNGLTIFNNADASGTTNVSDPNYSTPLPALDALGGR